MKNKIVFRLLTVTVLCSIALNVIGCSSKRVQVQNNVSAQPVVRID